MCIVSKTATAHSTFPLEVELDVEVDAFGTLWL